MVASSTAGGVVCSTKGAGGGRGAYNTGDHPLAGGLVHRAATDFHLLRECAQDSVLIAVEQRLSRAHPEANWPVDKEVNTPLTRK